MVSVDQSITMLISVFIYILLCRALCSYLVTENIGSKHRSWMSIAFSMSYPIGMILLAVSANYIHAWRNLQLSLTIPAFLLVFYC